MGARCTSRRCPIFAREVALTPVLAREVPGAAPRVLAADTARGFLLLADSGEAGPDDLPGLLRHLAWVQRASLPLLPTLGLRDRGPAYVCRWLPHLLSDEGLQVGQPRGFTPAEAADLRTRQPALDAALARLAASPLPPTLGHGDLHAGNVTARDGTFTLLDWSDGCATHPFLDANPAYLAPDDTPPEAWRRPATFIWRPGPTTPPGRPARPARGRGAGGGTVPRPGLCGRHSGRGARPDRVARRASGPPAPLGA
ncbi:phosphotransferase [Deinococcus multiflagellatus]|uniref:Phosphotransferase n=1 Tax=Deinococcus multiflagellatus TaxID=1656887 RepID=A0ABW1ZM69_9DEIO